MVCTRAVANAINGGEAVLTLPQNVGEEAPTVSKSELKIWVVEALHNLGGSGTVTDVARTIWNLHQAELEASGDLFYTWQYDIRWAAQALQDDGKLTKGNAKRRWRLNS